MVRLVQLGSANIDVTVDLDRGAELTSIRHIPTDTELLMVTPWADEARALRPVPAAYPPEDSEDVWQASYAGGWQTLFPHAGAPEEINGQIRQYHGEASIVPWELDGASLSQVETHVILTGIPVRLDRVIHLDDHTVSVEDRIENLSGMGITYDYQSHPAFGAPFLEKGCRIAADAEFYTPHPGFDIGEFEPGVRVAWPEAESRLGTTNLAIIPAADARALRFGWLEGFDHHAVTITNPRIGLAATLTWFDSLRKFAWLWQDAGADTRDPWNGRGYTTAVEPSTRTTAFGEQIAPVLEAKSHVTFITQLSLHTEKSAAKEHAQ